MKKKILFMALLSTLTSTAMAEGFYGALDIGQSSNKDACAGVGAGATCNESGTAFRLGGGYQFTPNWGIEANYGILASSKASAGSFSGEIKPRSIQIAATGTFPIANAFSVIGKIGIASNVTEFSATTLATQNTTTTKLAYGIGAQYDISKTLGVRAQYESLGEVNDPPSTTNPATYKISMISAGLVLKF